MKIKPFPPHPGRLRSTLRYCFLVFFLSFMTARLQAQNIPPVTPISFNGVDQYIKVPHDPKLDFTTGTIEMWLKPDWTTAPQNLCFISMREQGSNTRFSLHMEWNKSGIGLYNGSSYLTRSFSFANQTWYHVAFVMGTSDTEIFVNGISRGFTGNTLNRSLTGYDLKIGISELVGTNSVEYFKGEMDEIRVWNVKRTATEIQQNMSKSVPANSPGLVAYFPIDADVQSPSNSSTRQVSDRSANGLNGQLMNYFGPVPDAKGIVYVKKNGTGNNAGSSWANAYAELAGALIEAKTNKAIKEIWVAEGNYRPLYSAVDNKGPNLTDRNNAFVLVSNVKLYGGFAGHETAIEQRNWKNHKTVLSGDLDGNNSLSGANAYHVLVGVNWAGVTIDNNVVVDGFTISGGNANQSGSVLVNGVSVAQNSGGGMSLTMSSPILSNLIFEKNNAFNGGAVANNSNANPKMDQLLFQSNTASGTGGALFNSQNSRPQLTDVEFSKNVATMQGGAIGNVVNSNALFTNTLFAENEGGKFGGAIYNYGSNPVLTNVTVSGNAVTTGGGAIYNDSGTLYVRNSIVWNNKVNNDATSETASIENKGTNASVNVVFSTIAQPPLGAASTNSIVDPEFTNAAAGDYTLKATSPAIDAGSNDLYIGLNAQTKDLAGNARLQGSTIDMGAYEAISLRTAPQITAVTVPAAKTYKASDYLEFQVNFDQNIVVNTSGGTPRIPIEMGTSTVYANYVSGTGGTALLFRYIVETGDKDEDGIVLNQMELNGGTIQSLSADVANLTLNNVGVTTGVKVFAEELKVLQVKRTHASPTKLANVTFRISFSSAVTGVTKASLDLVSTGSIVAAIGGISTTDNINYNVTVQVTSGDGEVRLDVKNTEDIQDAYGNRLLAEFIEGESFLVDLNPPLPPTGVSASWGDGANKLLWAASASTDVVSYKVFGGTTDDPIDLLTTTNTLSFTHTGLDNGTPYYYRIVAVDAVGNESVGSTVVHATPKGEQTISFNDIVKTYGNTDFEANALASSGLEITYLSDNPAVATIVNGKIHIVAAGTANITARQSGNAAYAAAVDQVRTLTVTPRALVLTAIATDKIYDATTNATVTLQDNRILGDQLTISYGAATFDNKDVSVNKLIMVSGITLNGADAGNYTFSTTVATQGTITPRMLTVAAGAEDKVYDGNTNATVTLNANSLAGDDLTVHYSSATFNDKHVGDNKPVTVKGITLTGTDAGNYTFSTTVSAIATISKAPLAVTAVAKSKVYGAADPELTYVVTPGDLQNGDNATVVSGALERAQGENIGTYPISNKSLTAANYTITYTPANLAISKAALTVTAVAKTKVYGAADPELTYVVTPGDLRNGDDATVVSGALERAEGENVGTYPISNKNLTASNYTISYTPANLAITRATLSGLDFTHKEFVYDGSAKSLQLSGTLPAGVQVAYQNNDKMNAGSYEVTAVIAESSNYFGTSFKAILTIHKAKQTIHFTAPETLGRDAGIITLDASSTSGLAINLAVDDPMIAKIKDGDLEVLRLGTVRITATQLGNENYEAASPITVAVRIANSPSTALPILVHKAVSPNGDGINEFLIIEGIGDYLDNKVTIFDKSGVVLKEIVGYNNKDKVFTGQYHRDGTYYYYLDVRDGNTWKREKGYFVIKR